mmetsp:Transcript_21281/g.45473  ORF Transcript_21281/g.45473 Transcript_21281/m.45473 type:complete len:118 (-) Transcript_21281:658-1011(-)
MKSMRSMKSLGSANEGGTKEKSRGGFFSRRKKKVDDRTKAAIYADMNGNGSTEESEDRGTARNKDGGRGGLQPQLKDGEGGGGSSYYSDDGEEELSSIEDSYYSEEDSEDYSEESSY